MKYTQVITVLKQIGLDMYEPDPLCSDRFFERFAVDQVRRAVEEDLAVPASLIRWANERREFGRWMETPQTRDNNLDRGRPWPNCVYEALGTEPPKPFRTWEESTDFSRRGRGWDY